MPEGYVADLTGVSCQWDHGGIMSGSGVLLQLKTVAVPCPHVITGIFETMLG